MKKCVHCGAQLPDTASFCPYCRRRQAPESEKAARRRPWNKLIAIAVVLGLALAAWGIAALVSALRYTPVTLNAQGPTLRYRDSSGSYVLSLGWDSGESSGELSRVIAEGEESAAVSLLFVRDENGEDRHSVFLRRTAEIRVEAVPRAGAEAMTLGEAEPSGETARAVPLRFTTACGTNDIVWNIRMKNGDRLILSHALRTVRQRALSYSYQDYDIDTLEKLEALLAQIGSGAEADTVATIYLPPVRYEGGLRLDSRCFSFIGSRSGDSQTCFTDTVYVDVRQPQFAEFENIAFEGSGGTGLSAREGVILRSCRFEGWDIGVDSRDGSWVASFNCSYIANGVGFRFDSTTASLSSPTYSGNSFIGNGVGFSILRTPSREVLSFPGCRFERNRTDIENTAGKTINTKGATFVPLEDKT